MNTEAKMLSPGTRQADAPSVGAASPLAGRVAA